MGIEKTGQTKRHEAKKNIMKRELLSNDLFEKNLSQESFNTWFSNSETTRIDVFIFNLNQHEVQFVHMLNIDGFANCLSRMMAAKTSSNSVRVPLIIVLQKKDNVDFSQ